MVDREIGLDDVTAVLTEILGAGIHGRVLVRPGGAA